MDIFDNGKTNSGDNSEINFIEEVTKKFNKEGNLDIEALAKGKVMSDRHIQNLESELAAVRRDLETRQSVEEAITKLRSSTPPMSNHNNQKDENENEVNKDSVSKDDIAELIRSAIIQEKTQSTQSQNVSYVVGELRKSYGDSFPTKVKEVTAELGVGEEFMKDLAAKQPKAFLKLVSDTSTNRSMQTNTDDFSPPRNTIGFKPDSSANAKTYKYYSEMRKKNPSLYHSVTIQNEMFNQARRLGDDFYK